MKLDYKLLNIALICFICYVILSFNNIWLFIINKIIKIILPILVGFAISYFLYPILNILNKKIPKVLSIGILILSLLFLLITIFILIIPLLYEQIISLINYILIFIKNNNIDFNFVSNNINIIFDEITNFSSEAINTSIDFITNFIICISISIYFLIDMDKIRNYIKNYLYKKNNRLYKYLKLLDVELNNYFKGLSKLIIITFFEYTIIYYILGHPHALLLGFLSAISNLIPCFGGFIVQIIAFITTFIINTRLAITVLIITFILSIFDSYILNPYVYGKSNKIHPVIVILSVFAGGILFGFIGVLISLPISIIIVSTIKFWNDR